eukprot:3327895-Alexandrium_andersonii.AAC.1
MLEQRPAAAPTAGAPAAPGLRSLGAGRFVAYRGPLQKRCRIGRVTQLAAADATAVAHRYGALNDSRLRVQ